MAKMVGDYSGKATVAIGAGGIIAYNLPLP